MSSIHFFTPVTFMGDKNWAKRALETADRYFVFTGPYISIASDNSLSLNESEKSQPRWQHVAIRIVSYCTIILPLIALATKALLRWHLNIPSTYQPSSSCDPYQQRVSSSISSSASKTEQIPRAEKPKLQELFEQLEEHQKELDELTSKNAALEKRLNELTSERDALEGQLYKLDEGDHNFSMLSNAAQKQSIATERNEIESKIDGIDSERDGICKEMDVIYQKNNDISKEKEAIRFSISDMRERFSMGFMESFPINPINLDAFKKIVEENHQSNDSLLRDRALAACTYLTAHGYPVGYTLAKEIAQKYFKQFQPFNNQQARQHNESESKEYGRLDLFDEEEKIDRPSSKDILFAFSFFALSLTDPRFKLQLDELTLALNSMPLTLNLVDEAHQYTYHSPSYTPIIDCVSPVISGMFKRILSEHINLVRKKCEQLIVLCKNDSNFVQVYLDLLLDLPQLTLPEHLLGITLNDSHSIFQDASKRAFFLKLIERGTKENVLSFVLDMQNINFRSINLDCLQQIMSALIAKWANDLEVVAKILEIAKSAINPDYEDDGVSTVMYNALLDLTKNVYDQLAGKKTAISFLNLINFLIEKANPNQIEQIKELLKKVFLAQDTSQDQTQSTIQNSIIEKILDNPADERFAMLLEIADEMCLSQYFGVNNRGWDLFGKLLGENSEATLKYLTLFVQTKLTKATDLNSPLSSILDFVNQLLNPLHEHANKWARKFRTEKSQESVSKLLEILEQLRKMNTNESTTKQIQSLITIAENMMEKRRPLLFS